MNAVDTNILLYVHDPRDASKRQGAISLVRSITDWALLWQVALEYLAASRKLGTFGYDQKKAWEDIRDLRQIWTIVLPSWSMIDKAEELLTRYSLSLWDAMIIAACVESGINRLYSEDFDAYPKIESLEIINSFKK